MEVMKIRPKTSMMQKKRSFGINVARLAGVPEEVLGKAKAVSSKFEKEMNGSLRTRKISPANAIALRKRIEAALQEENWEEAERIVEPKGGKRMGKST
eukprot:9844930-Ditylum_brightwellii.AAC.1